MNTKRLYKGAFSLILIFNSALLVGCSNSDSNAGEASTSDDSVVAVTDSAALKSEEKIEEPAPLKFSTAREALDYMHQTGKWEEYAKGILPKMAEENLDWCTKLLNNKYSRFLVVDKGKMKVIVYNKYGVREIEYPMACSRNYGQKHGRWDSRTPEGFFSAEGIYDSTDWKFTNENGYTSPAKGVYGTRFIRIKAPQTSSCGIHGTSSPGSIGRRASHGCVRVSNQNILELIKYVEVGMPIIVNPGPKDRLANERENCKSPWITTDATPCGFADSGSFGGADGGSKPKETNDSIASSSQEVDPASSESPATEPVIPAVEATKSEESAPAE